MIQALADGILTGAIIALGAIGVTFTLEIMRFANFAHSELLTWGAYIALVIVTFAGPGTPTGPLSFGWQLLAAALIAAVLTGLAAWAVDTLVFRRLRRRGALPLTMVFAAFGAALVMRHLIVLVFGHESRYYTPGLQGRDAVPAAARDLDPAAAGPFRRAELDARLPRVLRVRRADPRCPRPRIESAVGVHRVVQRRRRRVLRHRCLHARDPHRGAPTPVRRQFRPALARGGAGRDGRDGARELADRPRHDPPARRLPGHRHVRRRRLDPARRSQLGAAHRRRAGAHAHRQAAGAAVRDAVRLP